MKLTQFEGAIIRLDIVNYRLVAIDTEFPHHAEKNRHSQAVKNILRDAAIEQLYNLIKIRDDMLKEPRFKSIDDSLECIIQPIIIHREPIKKIRNNYISHIQEKDNRFSVTIQEIHEKHNFPMKFAFFKFLCGLGIHYINFILANFKKEVSHAREKHRNNMPAPLPIPCEYTFDNIDAKIDEILTHVRNEIQKNNMSI